MFRIIVEADYALYTRPECKVERATYPVPTPSALEGMLKAIFWKPAIKYVIDKIVVFHPIRYAGVRRNEVKDKILPSAVRRQMRGDDADPCVYTKESISQRASLLLRDVRYGVEFHFEMTGIRSDRPDETPQKYVEIIRRRLAKGQFFQVPFLGCREFPIRSLYAVEQFDFGEVDPSLMGERDLGIMLYGLRFHDDARLREKWDASCFSDAADAVFYHPRMRNGVIDVAKYREAES